MRVISLFVTEITTPSLSTIFKMTHAYTLTPRLILFTSANGWDGGNLAPANSFCEIATKSLLSTSFWSALQDWAVEQWLFNKPTTARTQILVHSLGPEQRLRHWIATERVTRLLVPSLAKAGISSSSRVVCTKYQTWRKAKQAVLYWPQIFEGYLLVWSLIPGKENSHLKSRHFKVKFPNFVGKRDL